MSRRMSANEDIPLEDSHESSCLEEVRGIQSSQGEELIEKAEKHSETVIVGTMEEQWTKALEDDDVKKLFSLFDQSKTRMKHTLLELKQEDTGATAFHLACLHNHEEFVTDALELDIYYRDVEDANGNTALHLACKGGHLNIVKILLECVKEFDKNHRYVNQRNQNGSSPLMFAASFGHAEIVKFLVKRYDANPNMKNKKQQTALDLSKAKRHSDVSEYLGKAVQKKAIEDFTKVIVVVGGIPFVFFILYKILLRL